MNMEQKRALIICNLALLGMNRKEFAEAIGVTQACISQRLNTSTKYGKKWTPKLLKETQRLLSERFGPTGTTASIPTFNKHKLFMPTKRKVDIPRILGHAFFYLVLIVSILHVSGVLFPLR